MFERVAFGLQVGQVSGITQSGFGYHLIKVNERVEDEDPTKESVQVSHILVLYDDDVDNVRNAIKETKAGKVELAFSSAEWMQFAPRAN